MRLLLDTHALLWWATAHRGLSAKARKAIAADDSEVYISAASAWEIATKVRLGKLEWAPEAGGIAAYVHGQGFLSLPMTIAHAEEAGRLAIDHRDPFDRMLIAQARAESLWLVSNETLFDAAGVQRYW